MRNSSNGSGLPVASIRKSIVQRMVGGIYVIVDPEHTSGRPLIDIALAAVEGGASAIQLRDKRARPDDLLNDAIEIAAICRNSRVVFIVNDHPDIAAASEAHGVHVGQGDASISSCRETLAENQIVGKSNALVEEARASVVEGADYIAVGATFPTSTKHDTRPAGLETLRAVASQTDVPVVAIGGINSSNVASVARAGADAVCVATAVTLANDPASAVLALAEAFKSAQADGVTREDG